MKRIASRAGALVALVAFVGLTVTGRDLRATQLTHREASGPLPLPDAHTAVVASMGYDRLASDYYWLYAIQYFGTKSNAAHGFRDLYRILDLVVTLDPKFMYAYFFGGVTVPYHGLGSGWVNGDKAIDLLDRGAKQPEADWRIFMALGYSRLWFMNDVEGAAAAIEKAAQLPGRPAYLPLLATRLRSQAGQPDLGIALAENLLRQTSDPSLREDLVRRIRDLEVERLLQLVEQGARRYREQRGQFPANVQVLVESGYLPAVNTGNIHIELDPKTGRASADALPQRILLPQRVLEEIAGDDAAPPKRDRAGDNGKAP